MTTDPPVHDPGDERLEIKLDGIAFGFLIPIFFITSGMAIDVSAVAASPGILIAFLILIVVVRGVPVFFVTKFEKVEPPFTTRESAQVALYGATGLPMIVAVTGAAVDARTVLRGANDALSADTAPARPAPRTAVPRSVFPAAPPPAE